ncbi:MAG: heavy-metal-associated domain-containing protein [Pelolinea sp.]|nr:heavy-metal-associated domain-containing protein [Pelolinea sp.]
MEKLLLNIPAIHCGHCAHTIKMELSDLVGVNSVDVDTEKKEISIDFEPPANEQEIRDLLAEINYPAEK